MFRTKVQSTRKNRIIFLLNENIFHILQGWRGDYLAPPKKILFFVKLYNNNVSKKKNILEKNKKHNLFYPKTNLPCPQKLTKFCNKKILIAKKRKNFFEVKKHVFCNFRETYKFVGGSPGFSAEKLENCTLKITVLKRPQMRLPPPPKKWPFFLGGGVNFFSERGLILS